MIYALINVIKINSLSIKHSFFFPNASFKFLGIQFQQPKSNIYYFLCFVNIQSVTVYLFKSF